MSHVLEVKNIEKYYGNKSNLTKAIAGISFNVLAKMGKNEYVSMESLHRICQTLSCDIGEIVEFIDE